MRCAHVYIAAGSSSCAWRTLLNQTTRDWYTRTVTLNEVKGLAVRFFATLRMTRLSGHVVKCANLLCFDLAIQRVTQQAIGMKLSRKRQCRFKEVIVGSQTFTEELGSGAALA